MYFKGMTGNSAPEITIGLLLSDQTMAKGLQTVLEASGVGVGLSLETRGDRSFLERLNGAELAECQAVALDIDRQPDPAGLVREVRERSPVGTPLVVIGRDNDVNTFRHMLAAGADDYFVHPLPSDELIQALRRLLKLHSGASGRFGRIVAVHGTHGGCGAGVLAAGIAAVLSQKHGRETALVDADVSGPTAGVHIGCDQPGNFGVLLEAGDRLDSVLIEQVIQKPMPRLAFLDGHSTDDARRAYIAEAPARIASLLGEQYRYQIWRSNGIAGFFRAASLMYAAIVVLVMTGTLPSARSAQQTLRWLAEHNPGARVLLVYNRPSPHPPIPAVALEEIVGRKMTHAVPYQRGLGEAMLRATPCNSPAHCLNRYFEAISADILGLPNTTRKWWRRGA